MLTQVINNKRADTLSIELMLGNLCNYKCWYCFPGYNEGDYPWPDYEKITANLEHLLHTYSKQGKTRFEFYIVGGEPTLWKQLPDFCSYMKSRFDVVIRISTNGSRGLSWWTEHCDLFDVVELSVHHEFAKVDHIIQLGDLLYTKKINVVANVLMDYKKFDKCKSILTQLKASKKRWPIVAKWVHFNGQSRYNSEQTAYLEQPLKRWPNLYWWYTLSHNEQHKLWVIENGKKKRVADNWLTLSAKNKFTGWLCNLGVDHIEIFQTGRIAGNCLQTIYDKDFYYNLYDDNFKDSFKPTIKPVICTKPICQCGFETNINKVIPILPL